MKIKQLIKSVWEAVRRAKTPLLLVALAYIVSVSVGMIMAHSGNNFALSYRDNLVNSAQSGPILTQESYLQQGLLDFQGNLLSAATDTITGLGIVTPFPFVLYRGWIGGIVSVDGNHQSRLADLKNAAYYSSVMVLQLLGYSLAAGAGIQLGLTTYRARPKNAGFFWFRIPKEALLDLAKIYALIVPIMLLASMWEFLSPWR